ncbi:HNH endonuclease [Arthrobacter sp. SX1312]|uniref:HNH endonuclease n=1 Tax=Arthrobacter sp. SX1312 TaxID=2058896 RepID=UPI002157C7CD|nr:HNH endonuclease [Arthrobacter sp. SX1312]
MLPTIDFADEEMTYKVESAAKLAAARDLLQADDPGWAAVFAGAFAGSNLLNWRYTDELVRAAKKRPEVLAPLLRLLWDGRLSESSFNRFVRDLRTHSAGLTPGVGTAVASVLLMGRGAADRPPYRPQAVRRFWRTIGWPATRNDVNPYLDYQNFRRSLDEFRTIASANALPVADLLTAQGYMWLITEWDPRTVLPASEIATFRAWRGDPYTGASSEGAQASARRLRILERLEDNETRLFTRNDLVGHTVDGQPAAILPSSHGTVIPPGFDIPVSLTLSPSVSGTGLARAVDDAGMLRYPHEKQGRTARADQGLLSALETCVPLVVLAPMGDSTYQAVFPVYVHRYLHRDRVFDLDVSGAYLSLRAGIAPEYERRWTVGTTRQRLHQPVFRRDVLQAYNSQCAVCGLSIAGLLDAAHIVPDRDDHGIASVINGLALCKNHHAAFDAGLLAVADDLTIHVSRSIMNSGPDEAVDRLLRDYDGRKLAVIPAIAAWRPDPDLLARTWTAATSKNL